MKLSTLKKQAQKATAARGHKMCWNPPFQTPSGGQGQSAECVRCNRWVTLRTQPEPNDIEVGGSAVALNCSN